MGRLPPASPSSSDTSFSLYPSRGQRREPFPWQHQHPTILMGLEVRVMSAGDTDRLKKTNRCS